MSSLPSKSNQLKSQLGRKSITKDDIKGAFNKLKNMMRVNEKKKYKKS